MSIGGAMIHYELKTCITNGVELYGFVQEEPNGQRIMSTRNAEFPESLLSFLYFDIEWMRPAFQRLADGVRKVITEKSREESDVSVRCLQAWRITIPTLCCSFWTGDTAWTERGISVMSFRRIICRLSTWTRCRTTSRDFSGRL